MPAKKGNILPKTGNTLPKKGNILPLVANPKTTTSYYEQAIAGALRRELSGSNKSVKTLIRWTGAGGRTVKNWISGLRGPSGAHLVALMKNSDVVFEAVLTMVGRPRAIAPENIAVARVHLRELLALLDTAVGRLANRDPGP
jgi:hypothetical protein